MSEANEGRMQRIVGRCPRCKSQTYDVLETVSVIDTHEVREGVIVATHGGDPVGTTKTEGRCLKCGHTWVFRRAHDWMTPNA